MEEDNVDIMKMTSPKGCQLIGYLDLSIILIDINLNILIKYSNNLTINLKLHKLE